MSHTHPSHILRIFCTLTEFDRCQILFPSIGTNILGEVTQNP